MTFWKISALAAAAVLAGSAAYAGCGLKSGKVAFLGNDFPAVQDVVAGAKTCAGDGVTVSANLNKDYQKLQVAALTANPAQYSATHVTTSSIVPLLSAGLLRPLDDLVAKYGKDLEPQQLIKIDGHVMAVAFMANTQHLFYRKDILAKVGMEPPKTYEDVLKVAAAVKAKGIMPYPFALNTKAGWNLAEEFVNMYLGEGGSFFKPGSAEPSINNPAGVKTLTMLKDLVAYSNPDYLTYDSNATQALWESGNLALATLWGSRGGSILDGKGAAPGVVENTVLAGAPTVGGGKIPATTLWWDGFAIAKNVSDADAEASFVTMVHAISPENILPHSADAVWLVKGYKPTPASAGVIATLQEGSAKSYPLYPYMGLMHTALGDTLPKFFQGQQTAEQTLADVEAAYTTAAKAKGFLK
ncbi:MAG: extracellular solute-binding protein [Paracoccaceae bacterium]|nr:extracellular solute-binding protein [Paracoccaceae bacterium]